MTGPRDPAAERYNRRTRAIEKQAAALQQIGEALTVVALAQTAQTTAPTNNGVPQAWTESTAYGLMNRLFSRTRRL